MRYSLKFSLEILCLLVFNAHRTKSQPLTAKNALNARNAQNAQNGNSIDEIHNYANTYLTQFGYMRSNANVRLGSFQSYESFRQAIMEFQAFANINQTGELDQETIKMMAMPRCGVKDKVGFGVNARRKRYALQGSRWKVRDLAYEVSKYPTNLEQEEVDRDVEKAFKVWEDVTDLKFRKAKSGENKVHIEIRFEYGEHGDGDPFDGPGGTLAHAYFPIYGGDVHFDSSEKWTVNSYTGTNLFQVAAHEFGHSLGLSHSDNQRALMAPFYRGYQPVFKLDKDDIVGIQSLYGKKQVQPKPTEAPPPPPHQPPMASSTSPPTENEPPPPVDSSLCVNPKFDAIVTMMDKETYVFKGEHYYKLTNEGLAHGYPRNISQDFENLPGNLDAAFTWSNGKTYFFKGDRYWRFENRTKDSFYPKPISKGFAGIPNDVDTAFVWSGNGKIYFMKGSNYWRFDPATRPPVTNKYPKSIRNWEGVPNNLEGALQYSNGYTYFFKNGLYYRFNDRAFRVDRADPPFPRPVGYWWFGCQNTRSSQIKDMQSDQERQYPLVGADDVTGEDTFDAVSGSNVKIDISGST